MEGLQVKLIISAQDDIKIMRGKFLKKAKSLPVLIFKFGCVKTHEGDSVVLEGSRLSTRPLSKILKALLASTP